MRLTALVGSAIGALMAVTGVQAATINLPTGDLPDITTSGTKLVYDWTGSGGTLVIKGAFNGDYTGVTGTCLAASAGVSAGEECYANSQQIKYESGESPIPIVDATQTKSSVSFGPSGPIFNTAYHARSGYNLTANFDSSGLFTSGTVEILGSVEDLSDGLTAPGALRAGYDSGTIITGTVTNFGFVSSDGQNAVLEFAFDPTGGDLYANGFQSFGGVIVGLQNVTHSSYTGSDWDNEGDVFKQDFYSSQMTIDTFVPLPAAAWLFGTGLLGLGGMAARRRPV